MRAKATTGIVNNLVRDAFLQFSSRLKRAVRAAGGNKVVAMKSGVPLSSLNNYLKGRSEPSAFTALYLAAACRVSLTWLLVGITKNDIPLSTFRAIAPPEFPKPEL